MRFVSGKVIEIGRELSDLDAFVLDFIKILRKHTDYVIISGYVSILLGRARSSEDIDVIIPEMDLSRFLPLLKELRDGGFYCLNTDDERDAHGHIKDGLALRFAKDRTVIPNAEVKFAKNDIDDTTLRKKMIVRMGEEELAISHLEMQIAFKEVVLKSPKDLEDARHIRNVAQGYLDAALIKKYERMLHGLYGR